MVVSTSRKRQRLTTRLIFFLTASCFSVFFAHSQSLNLIAVDDTLQATQNLPATVNILGNDSLYTCDWTTVGLNVSTPPLHGSYALNAQKKLVYTPSIGYTGKDSLKYVIMCGASIKEATVRIQVIPFADNVSTQTDCSGTPSSTVWDMTESHRSPKIVQQYGQPLSGDIDGDGKVEILVQQANVGAIPGGISGRVDTVWVFNDTLRLKDTIPLFGTSGTNPQANLAFADVIVGDNGKAEIFSLINKGTTSIPDFQIECLRKVGGIWTQVWISPVAGLKDGVPNDLYLFPANVGSEWPVNIADINNDGIAEVMVYDQIFNAQTGAFLVKLDPGPRGIASKYSPTNVLADMDNNGTMEAVCGSAVYKINITNPNGSAGNSAPILYRLNANSSNSLVLKDVNTVLGDGSGDAANVNGIMALGGDSVFYDGATAVADLNHDGYLDVIVNSRLVTKNTSGAVTYAWDPQTQKMFGIPVINRRSSATASVTNSQLSSVPFIGDVDGDGYPEVALTYYSGMVCWNFNPTTNAFEQQPLWRSTTTDVSGSTVMTMFDFNLDRKQEIVYRDQDNLRIIDGPTGVNLTVIPCFSFTILEYPIIVDANKDGHAEIVVSGDIVSRVTGTYDRDNATYLRMFTSATPGIWAATRNVWNQYGYNVVNINNDLTVPQYQMNPASVFPGVDGVLGTADDTRPFNGFLTQQPFLDQNGLIYTLFPDLTYNSPPTRTYYSNGDSLVVNLTVINQGSASMLHPIYVSNYKNEVKTANLMHLDSIMTDIQVGQNSNFTFTIKNFSQYQSTNLIIRLNDKGSASYTQPECDTTNNTASQTIVVPQLAYNTKTCLNTTVTMTILNPNPMVGAYKWYNAASGGTLLTTGLNYSITKDATPVQSVWVEPVLTDNTVCERIQYDVKLIPDLMYWKRTATNHNWNDPNNWVDATNNPLNAVPVACTNVHIPGNANYYPSLDSTNTVRTSEYGDPVCNNITYHFGSEVAKPHYLTYNRAYIQYNFGYYDGSTYKADGDNYSAAILNRGKWTALAAPLKKIASGDFSVGGFPNMWQQGFRTSPDHSGDIIGQWYVPENTNAMEIGPKQHFAICVWGGEYLPGQLGENDHQNLNTLKGVIEMPYFENGTVNPYHRIHQYDPVGKKSMFMYYYYQIPGLPLEPTAVDTLYRGKESFRFVFENDNNQAQKDFKVTVPAGDEVLIGNAFLSSLDFIDFYNHNSSVMEDYYQLYVNDNWETYSVSTGSLTLSPYIASFQGFLIKTKGTPPSTVDLYFPMSSSITRNINTAHQLRSSSEESFQTNVLYLKAESATASNWSTVAFNTSTEKNNVGKIFTPKGNSKEHALEFYTLGKDNHKNTIQYESGDKVEVPFGVRCDTTVEIKLSVRNMEQLNAESLVLEDKKLNKQYNLFEVKSVTAVYELTDTNRFKLLVGRKNIPTDVNPLNQSTLSISVSNRVLSVHSSQEIQQIELTTSSGVNVDSEIVRKTDFTKNLQLPSGIYLVSVKLLNGKIKTEKVVVE